MTSISNEHVSDKYLINPVNTQSPSYEETRPELRVSTKRWLILFLFSITSMANSTLFNSIPSINDIATEYYGVKATVVDWLPSAFTLVVIAEAFLTAHLITSLGLRKCMIATVCFHGIATSLHFAGAARTGFPFVFAGQMFCALGAGVVLQAPPRLSMVWFAENEHATATSVGLFANVFGAALGFIQSTHMVPSNGDMNDVSSGMFNLYLSQLLFCVVNLLLVVVFFDEEPPFPPTYAVLRTSSYSGEVTTLSLKESLKFMLTDTHMLLLCNVYGLYLALYCFLSVCLCQLVKPEISDDNMGWMGFSFNCFGILSIIFCGILIDKYKCYKLVGCVLSFGSLACWALFTYLLLYVKHVLMLFIVFSVLSVFAVPFFAIGIEQLAEMSYPVPEGTSASVAVLIGNVYAFLTVQIVGALVDNGHRTIVCYVIVALYALSFIILCLIKTEMRRQNEERKHKTGCPEQSNSDDQPVA